MLVASLGVLSSLPKEAIYRCQTRGLNSICLRRQDVAQRRRLLAGVGKEFRGIQGIVEATIDQLLRLVSGEVAGFTADAHLIIIRDSH